MTITYHNDLIQGTDEWLAARCGMLTASEIKLIMTPTGKVANNDKSRAHLWELAAQRITGHVEPSYISDDMMRGMQDEPYAREIYDNNYWPTTEAGFVTNNEFGFTLGYSPDGLVSDDGLIEIKSRRQKYQIETIWLDQVPEQYMLQLQTGLLVTRRDWIDFVSYTGGLPMYVKRVYPDDAMQTAILNACEAFEAKLADITSNWQSLIDKHKYPMTERIIEQEMTI